MNDGDRQPAIPKTGHPTIQFAAVEAVVANLRREMVARIAGGRDADTLDTELRAAVTENPARRPNEPRLWVTDGSKELHSTIE